MMSLLKYFTSSSLIFSLCNYHRPFLFQVLLFSVNISLQKFLLFNVLTPHLTQLGYKPVRRLNLRMMGL